MQRFMHQNQHHFLKQVLLILLVFVCSPVIALDEQIEQEELREVKLRMLVWEGYAPEDYRNDFKRIMLEEHNILVEFELEYISEPEQYLESLRRRAHEVICPTHNILKSPRWPLIQQKLVIPLRLENIPNFEKIVPSLQDSNFLVEKGKVYAAPFLQGTYGLAYNSDLVSEPESWEILWEPEYAKKYAVSSDYPEVNIYIAALTSGISKDDLTNVEVVDTPEFRQRLRDLAQNAKRVWHGTDTVEILSGLTMSTSWGFSLPDLIAKGEPWKMANPKEGAPAWVDTWALAAHLKHMPLHRWVAEKWINYILSDQAQLGYLRSLASTPTNTNVARIATAKEIREFHIGDYAYFENLLMWPTLPKVSQNRYREMWDEAFK